MKWNWGTGIVIGMIAFMSFITYMVVTMSTNKKFSYDLVTEEYYAKEMAYQTEIDAETKTNNLNEKIEGTKTSDGWLLSFPEELEASKINGKVFLYRPSNQQLDFDLPLVLSGSNLLIPDNKLIEGRWNITIAFTYNNEDYLYKKSITY
ncbi:FixH family protein [Ulvibacter litoralis]|uniref:Nitrogen fixation protein FixH n=1 Tax=Ulvibacter litoralis TaxID=227084 RepID=A0A1G7CGC0_9FLAO|nr:FixH family protein [Ulvibacter litoralis]GHC47447.1 cytochrome Cbb3 oxidase maturation protein CcoH [Ulvibacter litoralis]SDE38388.1 Nitrogen fixation protein FixH [Ulvibacter litoralis]